MDTGAHRELKVLEVIAQSERTTQRGLAAHLGIAVGLVNLYLKRLVRKGYVKCVNIQSNRVRYLITPKGIAEKSRLTYEFMEYSLQVFAQGRRHLRAILQPYVAASGTRIAIYGTGEAAELAYLCLKEMLLEPVAVFDRQGGATFFGLPVRALADHSTVAFDVLIVATFGDPTAVVSVLAQRGIDRTRLVTLCDPGAMDSRDTVRTGSTERAR